MSNRGRLRRFGALATAVALAATMAACSAPGVEDEPEVEGPGSLRIASSTEILTLDPQLGRPINQALTYYLAVFDGLYAVAADGTVQPKLAVDDEVSADGLTHTVTIRDDVTFHDGSPLTAEDVVFTFNRAKNPDIVIPQKGDIGTITAAEAVDDHTVRFTLSAPSATFENALTSSSMLIVPKAVVEAEGDEAFAKAPIGSGPFKYSSGAASGDVEIVAYDDYWGGAPLLDSVTFMTVPETATQVSLLQTGDVDVVAGLAPTQVGTLGDDFEVIAHPAGELIVGQIRIDDPALSDVRVRQALNYALDREGMIETILKGNGLPIGSISGPGWIGYDEGAPLYEYDPEKAKQLLADAGWNPDTEIALSLPDARYPGINDAAQNMVSNWAEVGIKVKLDIMENSAWLEQLSAGAASTLPALNITSATNRLADPVSQMASQFYGGRQSSRINDPEFNALIDAAGKLTGDARVAAIQKVNEYVHDQAIALPLWNNKMVFVTAKGVTLPLTDGQTFIGELELAEYGPRKAATE